MGRRKLEMKRIEDKSSLHVTFSKRRSGLIKKARQLSVLCDVQIALVIFSSRGRLYEFSTADSLANILERYQNHCETVAEASKDANEALLSHTELLHMVQCQLEEPTVDQLSLMDLVKLKKQLDTALFETRARKEKLLKAENELLEREVASMEGNEENTKEVVIGFSNPEHLGHQPQQQTLGLLQ
ncbi:hypothetical protein PTKIN_Ptkin02bG0060100 [Pterospermum kingtungense]